MRSIYTLLALGFSLFLVACSPESGPKFEPHGFTKTFVVPTGKDKWLVEMLIKSYKASEDKQSTQFYEHVEPIVIHAIKAESLGWDMKPPVSSDPHLPVDSMRTAYGKALCERIKESLQKNPATPIMSDCLIISLVKI